MDTLVKERLTGAFILVGLIVVLVPELLSGPIHTASRAHGPAASAEGPPLRSYTITLADEPHGRSGSLQMQAASTPAAEPGGAARLPEPVPAAAPATRPAPAMKASAPTTASAAAGTSAGTSGYVVQLGSFASRANAERLAAQVHGQGFAVSVSRGSAGRRLYRVQVGPARDRGAAEELAAQLRAKGHGGTVVPK
ncbi:MAG TPA: SPOR domain-containing protein [Steroidobacteraceae bacterium]|nr:SPOR domain-containing protein [Steroidobacteraceae bacterium]